MIPVSGSQTPLSVKTSVPEPKELIPEIMKALGSVSVTLPVSAGDIILADVFQSGADIISTRDLFSL